MRRLVVPLCLALLGSASAHAASSLRYGWDDCSNTAPDKSWAGPGVYTQVLSVTGASGPFSSFDVSILNTVGWNSAWYGLPGPCQSQPPEFVPSVGGCEAIPGLVLTSVQFGPNLTNPRGFIIVHGEVPAPVALDPAQRYGLFSIRWHLDGPQAATCGFDGPACFHVIGHSFDFAEGEFVSFNDPGNLLNCPFATPVSRFSWGRLKTSYR